MNEDEKIRKFLGFQYAKIRRMASIISLILLMTTNALLLIPYLEARGVHPYVSFVMVVLLIIAVVWLLSHLYYIKGDMHRAEQLAEVKLNPYQIYELAPKEQMQLREMYIPLFEANIEILRKLDLNENADKLSEKLEILKEWVEMGRIPKGHFPPELEGYIISNKESRL